MGRRDPGRATIIVILGVALVLCATLPLCACSRSPAATRSAAPTAQIEGGSTAPSLPARLAVTQAGQDDMAEAVKSNNDFSLDLFQAVRSKDENLVCSPYSLSLALTMTMAGARGQTLEEMKQTLHTSLPYYRLNRAMNALDQSVAGSGSFTCANSMWGQAGRSFKQPFVDLVGHYYGATLRLLDMEGDYTGACKTINDWVSEKTNGRITGLMDPGDKPSDKLLMMLVNAVHFKADWLTRFPPEATQAQPFYLLDASKVHVPTMRTRGDYRFLKTKELQAVELPYENEQFAMVIVMPAAGGFEQFAGTVDPQKLASVADGLEPGRLDLWLPSFEITSAPKVTEALQAMGMSTAFTPMADLTGIADPVPGWPPWVISAVRQKAFIKIDERGTEAAAASGVTSVPGGTTTTAGPPLEIRIDHPFTYLIRDTRSGAILFIGQVVDPQAKDEQPAS